MDKSVRKETKNKDKLLHTVQIDKGILLDGMKLLLKLTEKKLKKYWITIFQFPHMAILNSISRLIYRMHRQILKCKISKIQINSRYQ